jgi:RNA polymerase nonessential primary-like sigma factor
MRLSAGDATARDALICHHLGLVISLARRFNNRGLELLDLIEEGNLALLVALEKFDTARGVRFSTYAGWWIRYFIQTALATQVAIVRPPLRAQKQARSGAWAQWQAMHGAASPDTADEPAAAPLVTSVAMHDADIESELSHSGHVGGDVMDDVAATRDGRVLSDLLRRLVAELPPRQRSLVEARFGLDGQDECTLADLGKDNGVSRERMRQVQAVALQTLRDGLARAGVTRAGAFG